MQVKPFAKSSKGPPTGFVEFSSLAQHRFEMPIEQCAEWPALLSREGLDLPEQGFVDPERDADLHGQLSRNLLHLWLFGMSMLKPRRR